MSPRRTATTTNGEETDAGARLERAALEMIERDGVLAGLNLRQAADEAGVSRGLVYHYFGDRRSLLRSAFERAARERGPRTRRREKMPAADRLRDFFRACLRNPTHIRLLTMLVLDGDHGVIALPHAPAAREANVRDVEAGILADDVDIDALHVGLMAAVYGWMIYRQSFAASVGRKPSDLDADVLTMIGRMWSARPPGHDAL